MGTAVGLTFWSAVASLTGKTLPEPPMTVPATTTLSSKGQVVIPEEIRARLGLEAGTQFVVLADRDVVIFKVLEAPSLGEFATLVGKARQVARQTSMKRADIPAAVAKARRRR